MKNSKSNRVFCHCPLPPPLPFPTLASSFIFLPDFSRARAKRENRERGRGEKCIEQHIFALVDDENDTEFSNSSLTHTHTHTHRRAFKVSYHERSKAWSTKVYTCGVACDTASCNANPESGLKAVYTHLACASFHSRRKRRSTEGKG